jgi:hypothetical protein
MTAIARTPKGAKVMATRTSENTGGGGSDASRGEMHVDDGGHAPKKAGVCR